MDNIDDILFTEGEVKTPDEFPLESHEPIYTEDIDNETAKTLVGPAYKSNYTYKLITQAESTIVAMFDSTGALVDEVTLDSSNLVTSISKVNQDRLLRVDVPPTARKEYDLYEVKNDRKAYLIPLLVLGCLAAFGVMLLIYTLNYLV